MSDQTAESEEYTREELEAMTVSDLRSIAGDEGLSTSGTKADLVDSILENQEDSEDYSSSDAPESTQPSTTPEPSGQEETPDSPGAAGVTGEPGEGGQTLSEEDAPEEQTEDEFQEDLEQRQAQQGIEVGSDTVPEQRPQAFLDSSPQGAVYTKMQEQDDPRVSTEPMGFEEHQRAAQGAQQANGEGLEERLYPGAYVRVNYQDDPDHPDNGRTAAMIRVESYADTANTLLAAAGVPESRFAKVGFYELRTRDGRHELLHVAPENLERLDAASYYKNPT